MQGSQPLRSGELNQRISFSAPYFNSPPDEIAGYTLLATVWAAVAFTDGDKALRGDREVILQKAQVRVRFRTDLSTATRATLNSIEYDILKNAADGILNLREFLLLTIREVR